jgi:hypothetical protein
MIGDALAPPVRRFVSELSPVLRRLNQKVTEADVAVEAFDIVASFVDADERHSDDELAEVIVTFAPWLDHLVGSTPAGLRDSDVVATRKWGKYQPSSMVEVLLFV